MELALEIAANALTTVSILLAARNSVLTWPTGILGCLVFALVFVDAKLYADALLQVFFVATSLYGWRTWSGAGVRAPAPVARSGPSTIATATAGGLLVAGGYGFMLHRFTDAAAPFADSAVLAFSVVAQILLMGRRLETWWFWLIVNTIAVPLFSSRGLWITAGLYAAYWFNAFYGLSRWRRELRSP